MGTIDRCFDLASNSRPNTVAILSASVVSDALSALRAMASVSLRSQAELRVALHRAGLLLTDGCAADLVDVLQRAKVIENVIELSDGGVFLTVIPSSSSSRSAAMTLNLGMTDWSAPLMAKGAKAAGKPSQRRHAKTH